MKRLLPIVLLFAFAAHAEVVEQSHVATYKVVAPSETVLAKDSISKAIDAATPIKAMRTWHTISKTETNLSWSLDMRGEKGGCKVHSHKVLLVAHTLIPRLESENQALKEKIGKYNAYFERHEREHLKIARKTAQQIDDAIGRMATGTNCDELQAAINSKGRELAMAGKNQEHEFDLAVSRNR